MSQRIPIHLNKDQKRTLYNYMERDWEYLAHEHGKHDFRFKQLIEGNEPPPSNDFDAFKAVHKNWRGGHLPQGDAAIDYLRAVAQLRVNSDHENFVIYVTVNQRHIVSVFAVHYAW